MFWTQKAPPSRLEELSEVAQEKIHDAAHTLDSLKTGALEKIATTRAHLDDATKKAVLQAEREAQEARLEAEKERATLLAEHEKWKADLFAERAKIEKARLETERLEKEALLRKTKGRRLIVADEDELDIYPLQDEDFETQKGGAPILLILGAIILVAVALFFLLSGTQGRRSRAAIKDRLDQVKDGLSDAATKSADTTAERVENLADKADAKAAAVAEEVGETSSTLAQKIEGAGEALATKIEAFGEHIGDVSKSDDSLGETTGTAQFASGELVEILETDLQDTPEVTTPHTASTEPLNATPTIVNGLGTREIDNEIEATLERIESSAKLR